jgi:hypothetical protein
MVAVDGEELFACQVKALSDFLKLDLVFGQKGFPVERVPCQDHAQTFRFGAGLLQDHFNAPLVVLVANRQPVLRTFRVEITGYHVERFHEKVVCRLFEPPQFLGVFTGRSSFQIRAR